MSISKHEHKLTVVTCKLPAPGQGTPTGENVLLNNNKTEDRLILYYHRFCSEILILVRMKHASQLAEQGRVTMLSQ